MNVARRVLLTHRLLNTEHKPKGADLAPNAAQSAAAHGRQLAEGPLESEEWQRRRPIFQVPALATGEAHITLWDEMEENL